MAELDRKTLICQQPDGDVVLTGIDFVIPLLFLVLYL